MDNNISRYRVHHRIYTDTITMRALDMFNHTLYLKSIVDVNIGEDTFYCQSSWQIKKDGRRFQMLDNTILEWHIPGEDMEKQFNIISITPGFIPDIPLRFNGNILLLRCV